MSRLSLPVVGRRDMTVDAPADAWVSFLAEDPGAAPALSLDEEAASDDALLALLRSTLDALRAGADALFEIPDPDQWALLQRTLGRGEVEGEVAGQHRYLFWETALPGVWCVETRQGDALQSAHLELGAIPGVVMAASEAAPRRELPQADLTTAGLMNGPALLGEIRHHMMDAEEGSKPYVISFSQLPVTPEDIALLDAVLGRGPIRMVSRGYGTCNVQLTGARHVWSVQHFNANGALILDTLEIGGIPEAVLAAPEDLDDAAARLEELLDEGVSA